TAAVHRERPSRVPRGYGRGALRRAARRRAPAGGENLPCRRAPSHCTNAAVNAFRKAMHVLGWVEGQTLLIDYRGAEGKGERLEQLAAEIVKSRPDVIVTGTSGAVVAAKRATATIPIVMAVSVDPVGLCVVQSLARPGGNVTGQAILSPELSVKRLELLKEALPSLSC